MAYILVVDDDATLREVMTEILHTEAGHQVISAGDAESCVEILRSTEVDLVLADFILGSRRSGPTLYEQLREADVLRSARFAYVSGVARKELEQAGIGHYLLKPFDVDELISFVAGLLTDSKKYPDNQSNMATGVYPERP